MAKLPLTLNPEEVFQISIFGILYNMRQLWNISHEYWSLDINDENNNPIINGIKLTSNIFLLQQYPELRFDLKSYFDLYDPDRNNLLDFSFEIINKDV